MRSYINLVKMKKIERKNLKLLLKHGYVVIDKVISERECRKIKNIYFKIFKKYKKKIKIKNPLEDVIYNLHNKDDIFLKYIDHKKIINIVKKALSVGSFKQNDFIVLRQSAIRNPQKGHAQQLHNDTRIAGINCPLIIQAIWMIDEFNDLNGGTRVVPNSQTSKKFPINNKKYKNELIIKGKKGSVLLLNAGMWHGSSTKKNHDDRLGMIFSYSKWFLKGSFDHTLNTPLKVYKKLNTYQRELLGFKFAPPIDEFANRSSRSKKNITPNKNYNLP